MVRTLILTTILHRRIVVVLTLLPLLVFSPSATGQRRIAANTIVKRMADKYAAMSSYQDEGIVVTTYDEVTGGRIEKRPFTTLFKRPALFRFEWIEYSIAQVGKSMVVWSNGKDAFTYWEPNRYEKEENLDLAIAGATGVSGGSAYTVPTMLLPEFASFRLVELIGLSVAADEIFEETLCYHLKGTMRGGDPTELWIGKHDLLLRKLRGETKYPDRLVIKEEIHRKIRADQPIANEAFDFKPPIAMSPPRKDSTDTVLSELLSDEAPSWSVFNSPEGRFSLLMPTEPKIQTLTVESSQGRFEHHVFMSMKGNFVCVVDYVDLPRQFLISDNSKSLYDSARDEFIKGSGAKLQSESPISMDGHEGREIQMLMFGGEARMRVFLIDGRLYQFAITRVLVNKKPDEALDKVLKSIKVFPNQKPTASYKAPQGRSSDRISVSPA